MASSYDPGAFVGDGDWLALHRNENLFIDRVILDEMLQRCLSRVDLRRYPDANSGELRRAIAEYLNMPWENVIIGNGSDEILAMVLSYYRATGYTDLIVNKLGYKVYPMLAERLAYNLHTFGKSPMEEYCRLVRPSIWALDSPNSLSGIPIPRADIRDLSTQDRTVVIWDNVYGEFAQDEIEWPLPNSIVFVRSFSKFFGLASLRIGYGVAEKKTIAALISRKDIYNVNAVAQEMALEVLRNVPYFRKLCESIRECRIRLKDALEGFGFNCTDSKANFLWVTHTNFPAEGIETFLRDKKILVRRFPDPDISNYLRIAVCPDNSMDRLLTELRSLLA